LRMDRKEPPGDLNKSSVKTEKSNQSSSYKLGMFPGVFTPSILTILGIILFLRMGYTVGHAGLGKVLILVTIASLVSILTTTSLSAIATNLHVKGGGGYYLISRTLGVQFGGAIGLPRQRLRQKKPPKPLNRFPMAMVKKMLALHKFTAFCSVLPRHPSSSLFC